MPHSVRIQPEKWTILFQLDTMVFIMILEYAKIGGVVDVVTHTKSTLPYPYIVNGFNDVYQQYTLNHLEEEY